MRVFLLALLGAFLLNITSFAGANLLNNNISIYLADDGDSDGDCDGGGCPLPESILNEGGCDGSCPGHGDGGNSDKD